MNIIFHTTVAIGICVAITNTKKITQQPKQNILFAGIALIIGVILHGFLDYIPHCYPFAGLIDVIVSLFIMAIVCICCKPIYLPIVFCAFTGSILPDLIDLAPSILNTKLGWSLQVHQPIFPWHWKSYSGSIFIKDCNASHLNHLLVVISVVLLIFCRKDDVKSMLSIKKNN